MAQKLFKIGEYAAHGKWKVVVESARLQRSRSSALTSIPTRKLSTKNSNIRRIWKCIIFLRGSRPVIGPTN